MVARVCAAIAFGTWSLVALAGSSLAQPGRADPHRGHELAIDRHASSPTRADVPTFAELWGPGEMPSGMRKGRPVAPIVDAEDVGDARRGAAYAQKSCSSCHNASASDAVSPKRQAPGFKKIANTLGMTVTALTEASLARQKPLQYLTERGNPANGGKSAASCRCRTRSHDCSY